MIQFKPLKDEGFCSLCGDTPKEICEVTFPGQDPVLLCFNHLKKVSRLFAKNEKNETVERAAQS